MKSKQFAIFIEFMETQKSYLTYIMEEKIRKVIAKIDWMKQKKIFPNGPRYLWTDAHGVVLFCSLYTATGEKKWLSEAESLVDEVDRVLEREEGYRIGEASNRDGQYCHYNLKWAFALTVLWHVTRKANGGKSTKHGEKAIKLAKDTHSRFFRKGQGYWWKMKEDLSGPYPGFGIGGLDHFDAYVVYRLINEKDPNSSLTREITEVKSLVETTYYGFYCTQDLGLGEALWICHWFPTEYWSKQLKEECVRALDSMWKQKYFCRTPKKTSTKFRFTNYGVSIGLQSWNLWPDRVEALNKYFSNYRSNDRYDFDAITHVMECNSLLPGHFLDLDIES